MTLRLHREEDEAPPLKPGTAVARIMTAYGQIMIDPETEELTVVPDPKAAPLAGVDDVLKRLQERLNQCRCTTETAEGPRTHTYIPAPDGTPVRITEEFRESTISGQLQREALVHFIDRVSGGDLVTATRTREMEELIERRLDFVQKLFDQLGIRLHEPS